MHVDDTQFKPEMAENIWHEKNSLPSNSAAIDETYGWIRIGALNVSDIRAPWSDTERTGKRIEKRDASP
jgi:hypothetical protein